jgi:hypothetical protein
LDVCTPIQINGIASALVDRLKGFTDFKTCFVLARLYHILKQNETEKIQRWRNGYLGLLAESKHWPENKVIQWKELVEGEIEAAGYEVFDVVGEDISYPGIKWKKLDIRFSVLWLLQAPISLGPMGHTLTFLLKSIMREQLVLNGKSKNVEEFYAQRKSALHQYLTQLMKIEEFIQQHGTEILPLSTEKEISIVNLIFAPAQTSDDLLEKVSMILDKYMVHYVPARIDSLRRIAQFLRTSPNLTIFDHAPEAIRAAYMVLHDHFVPEGMPSTVSKNWQRKNQVDAGQDALMVLALHNWKPKVCGVLMARFASRIANGVFLFVF